MYDRKTRKEKGKEKEGGDKREEKDRVMFGNAFPDFPDNSSFWVEPKWVPVSFSGTEIVLLKKMLRLKNFSLMLLQQFEFLLSLPFSFYLYMF